MPPASPMAMRGRRANDASGQCLTAARDAQRSGLGWAKVVRRLQQAWTLDAVVRKPVAQQFRSAAPEPSPSERPDAVSCRCAGSAPSAAQAARLTSRRDGKGRWTALLPVSKKTSLAGCDRVQQSSHPPLCSGWLLLDRR